MAKNEIVPQVNDVTRISAGTEIKGTINSTYDIRIDGVFDGKLTTTGKLVIGDAAKFTGEVTCKNCDIWGTIEGTIVVNELFGIKKTANVKGEISCRRLVIEEGGNLNGTCTMITDSKKPITSSSEVSAEKPSEKPNEKPKS